MPEKVKNDTHKIPKNIPPSHVDCVKRIAKILASRLPRHVELDDLISDGWLGYLDACRRFDPSLDTFLSFAFLRIRGAMIDGLRIKQRASKNTSLSLKECPESVAEQEYSNYLSAGGSPEQVIQISRAEFLECAMGKLDENDRWILTASYYKKWSLKKIGEHFGKGTSHVWRIRQRLLRKLRVDYESVIAA